MNVAESKKRCVRNAMVYAVALPLLIGASGLALAAGNSGPTYSQEVLDLANELNISPQQAEDYLNQQQNYDQHQEQEGWETSPNNPANPGHAVNPDTDSSSGTGTGGSGGGTSSGTGTGGSGGGTSSGTGTGGSGGGTSSGTGTGGSGGGTSSGTGTGGSGGGTSSGTGTGGSGGGTSSGTGTGGQAPKAR